MIVQASQKYSHLFCCIKSNVVLLLACFLLGMIFPAASFGQSNGEWSDWTELYNADGLKFEVSIKFDSTSCDSVIPSRYKYQVTGRTKPATKYITFKFDYITCDNRIFCEQLSFDIGPRASPGVEIKKMEYVFMGKALLNPVRPYYDIHLSDADETDYSIDLGVTINISPAAINGQTDIFYGDSTRLNVVGGSLSPTGEWKWYADSCGYIPVGTGSSIVVRPQMNTTYFVRGEDQLSESKCISATVTLILRSKDPERIGGVTQVCEGESTQLNVIGGHLGKGAKWVWYSDPIATLN